MGTGLVAAAGWLIYERWGRQFDWRAFLHSFAALEGGWLAAAGAAALATYWVRARRWAVMLKSLRPRPNHWGLFTATVIGSAFVVLIGRPAELVRPYLIATRERVPFSSQMGAWVLERVADLVAILLVFGFALTQVSGAPKGAGAWLAWVLRAGGYVAGAGVLVLLMFLILLGRSPGDVRETLIDSLAFLPERHLKRARKMLDAFLVGLSALGSCRSVARFVGYTALEWVLIAVCLLALFRAYPGLPRLAPLDVVVFMGLVSFGSLFHIPGIGGGVQLAAIVVLSELHAVGLELASSVAMMIWAITFVVVVPIGVPLALHEGLTWKRMRRIGEGAQL